jgi:hypothetical protein
MLVASSVGRPSLALFAEPMPGFNQRPLSSGVSGAARDAMTSHLLRDRLQVRPVRCSLEIFLRMTTIFLDIELTQAHDAALLLKPVVRITKSVSVMAASATKIKQSHFS